MDFTGKTAFITGAAKGIGRATAIGFAKKVENIFFACDTENCSYSQNQISTLSVGAKSFSGAPNFFAEYSIHSFGQPFESYRS